MKNIFILKVNKLLKLFVSLSLMISMLSGCGGGMCSNSKAEYSVIFGGTVYSSDREFAGGFGTKTFFSRVPDELPSFANFTSSERHCSREGASTSCATIGGSSLQVDLKFLEAKLAEIEDISSPGALGLQIGDEIEVDGTHIVESELSFFEKPRIEGKVKLIVEYINLDIKDPSQGNEGGNIINFSYTADFIDGAETLTDRGGISGSILI